MRLSESDQNRLAATYNGKTWRELVAEIEDLKAALSELRAWAAGQKCENPVGPEPFLLVWVDCGSCIQCKARASE